MERDIIRQRTKAGRDVARARGKKGGRPRATERIPEKIILKACEMYDAGKMSVPDILKLTGFKSRPTFYKYVVNRDKHTEGQPFFSRERCVGRKSGRIVSPDP